MSDVRRFPFGAAVAECGIEIPGDRKDAVVLGAYPSAVHVVWRPPAGSAFRKVQALAVDNEPWVFWDGTRADEHVAAWKRALFDPAWGSVEPSPLNGVSGRAVRRDILEPLEKAGYRNWFMTDCLTTYRHSVGGKAAIEDRYNPFAAENRPLQPAEIDDHPSENQIVDETKATQLGRLCKQISASRPRVLVTLGNAASRVVTHLSGGTGSGRLALEGYGEPCKITLCSTETWWFPLAHPAAPSAFKKAHRDWLTRDGFAGGSGTNAS